MTYGISEQVRRAFIGGQLQIGEAEYKRWNGLLLKSEPWTSMCFSAKDIAVANHLGEEEGDHYLEEAAIEDSEKIYRKEGWQGFAYLYSDEGGASYGTTIFYKRDGNIADQMRLSGSTIKEVRMPHL